MVARTKKPPPRRVASDIVARGSLAPRRQRASPSPKRAKKTQGKPPIWYLRAEEFAAIAPDDPAMEFASMLLAEPEKHCRWVHLAVRRHCLDLRTVSAANSCGALAGAPSPKGGEAAKSPFVYNSRKAQRAIDYARHFKVYTGEQVGKPMTMLPWQKFVIAQTYGWRLAADPRKRRFNYVYIAVPRKNGKTGLAAPLGLFHMSHPPKGGEVKIYSVATKLDQAMLVWEDAVKLLRTSSLMSRGKFRERHKRLIHIPSSSEWRPLGSDKSTLDGLRPDFALMDELHAWKKRDLWDVINTAFSAAFSPLVFQITTAGDDRKGICGEQEDRVQKVLQLIEQGTYTFEKSRDCAHYFGVIWTIDRADKWQDEKVWAKANPSLGAIKNIEDMRNQAEAAKQSLGARREFLIKHLNQWQETGAERWLDPEKWKACRPQCNADEPPPALSVEESWERLRGKQVYCGLDLSATTDTSAFCAIAVDEVARALEGRSGNDAAPTMAGHTVAASWQFWLPDNDLARRSRRDNVPYDIWAREGYLTLTPGEVVEIGQIEADIIALIEKYELDVVCLASDPWRFQGLGQRLADDHGLPVFLQPQSYNAMTEPLNELERLVVSGRLDHGANPIATEHALNAKLKIIGANGGRLIDKSQSNGRIDGLAALANAIGARLHAEAEGLGGTTPLIAFT